MYVGRDDDWERGHVGCGSRIVLIFSILIVFLLIIDGVIGFGPNLNAFTRLLLNKRVMIP